MVEFGNLGSLIRSAGCAVSLDPTSYLLQDEKAPSPVILSVWHTGLMLSPNLASLHNPISEVQHQRASFDATL